MTRSRWRLFIAIAAVVAVAIAFVSWKRVEARRLINDPAAVAAAEDEVYEAVVRHLTFHRRRTQQLFNSFSAARSTFIFARGWTRKLAWMVCGSD